MYSHIVIHTFTVFTHSVRSDVHAQLCWSLGLSRTMLQHQCHCTGRVPFELPARLPPLST